MCRGIESAQNIEKYGALSLFDAGRFSQIWNSSSGFGWSWLVERKHLRVLDAAARREPLHVAVAEARGGAQRVGVIDDAVANQRDRLEAPMRMARKARHRVAVIHAPAILALEVLADIAARERGGRTLLGIASRVGVLVIDTEQEGVRGFPRKAEGRMRLTTLAVMEVLIRGLAPGSERYGAGDSEV